MLSASEALDSCTEELIRSKRLKNIDLSRFEGFRADSSPSNRAKFSDESHHLFPQSLFTSHDDMHLSQPTTPNWPGGESKDLLDIMKNYFRNTKPGHFQKKVLNAHLQR
jgi:hypothetical protein